MTRPIKKKFDAFPGFKPANTTGSADRGVKAYTNAKNVEEKMSSGVVDTIADSDDEYTRHTYINPVNSSVLNPITNTNHSAYTATPTPKSDDTRKFEARDQKRKESEERRDRGEKSQDTLDYEDKEAAEENSKKENKADKKAGPGAEAALTTSGIIPDSGKIDAAEENRKASETTTEEEDNFESDVPKSSAGMAAAVETPEQKMQRQAQNKMNMERFTDLLTTVTRVAGGASAGLTSGLEAAQKITMSFLNGGMLPPIGTAIATYNTAVMDIGDNVIKNTGEAFGIKDGKYNPDLAGTLKGAQYYKQKAAAQVEQAQAMGRTIDMLRGATGMDVNADNVTEVLQNMSPEQVRNLTALVTAEMNGTKMRDALSRMNAGQGTPADKVYVQSMKELNKQVSNAVKTTKKRTNADYRQNMAELQYVKRQNKLDLKAYRLEDDKQFENDMDAAYDEINRLRSEGNDEAADRLEDQAVFTEYTREMILDKKIKQNGNEAIMDMNAWNEIKRKLLLRVDNGIASPAEERLYQKAVDVTESAKEYDKGASVQSWADNLFNKWVERTGGDRDMPFFDSFLSMTGNSKYSTRSGFNAFLNKINADPFDMPDDMRKKLFDHSNDEMKSLSGKVDITNPSDPNYRKYVELNAAKTISGWLEEEKMLWNKLDNLGLTKDAENNQVGDAFGKLKDANRNMEQYLPLLKHNDEALIFRSNLTNINEIEAEIKKQDNLIKGSNDNKYAKWRLDAYKALRERTEALNAVKRLMKKPTTNKKKKTA